MVRLPGMGPDSPLARAGAGLLERFPVLKRLTFLRTSAGLLLGFAILGLLTFVQISSTPQFCGTCHIMKPYYRSWAKSKHSSVACVECHISPGLTAEVRKKFEALSMVAKYFTGTWGTRPWGEVDDAACLRCHQRRLLEGKVQFGTVTFDHRPHMTELRRGMRLRCTSCHSQIVQGVHLTVTVSSCALCHFKGQAPNAGLGACQRCHQVPERVMTTAGVAFDHGIVSRLAMPCNACHGDAVRGDGVVAKERCLSCHNQAERLEKFGDKKFLHDMHVTKHKVDCQLCHATIEHGRSTPTSVAHAPETSNTCQKCHGLGHSPQQMLYAGVGARGGVKPMPGPMYITGVACQGCHNDDFSVQTASFGPAGPHSPSAGAVACMSCHGPSYQRIFTAWRAGVEERTSALQRQMERSIGVMGIAPPQEWEDARFNLNLVAKGKGIHNVNYAYVVLDKAFDQMNEARRKKGLGTLGRPWNAVATSPCLSCHLGIESQAGDFGERRFAHAPHLVNAKLECEKCHRPHNQRPKVEVVRFGPDGCTSCHHKALSNASFGECVRCHGDVNARTFPTFKGEFSHRQHRKIGEECLSCHAMQSGDPRPPRSRCTECHD